MIFGSKKNQPTNEEIAKESGRLLSLISPLIKSLYQNQALFVLGKGFAMMAEFFFYLLGLATFVFIFFMDTIFPFHVLGDIRTQKVYEQAFTTRSEIDTFALSVKGLVLLIAILWITIGVMLRNSNRRKALLQETGQKMKEVETFLMGQQKAFSGPPAESAGEIHKVEPKQFPEV